MHTDADLQQAFAVVRRPDVVARRHRCRRPWRAPGPRSRHSPIVARPPPGLGTVHGVRAARARDDHLDVDLASAVSSCSRRVASASTGSCRRCRSRASPARPGRPSRSPTRRSTRSRWRRCSRSIRNRTRSSASTSPTTATESPIPTEINIGRFFTTHLFFTELGVNMPYVFVKLACDEAPYRKFRRSSTLPQPGMVWIRGMDFEPVLVPMSDIEVAARPHSRGGDRSCAYEGAAHRRLRVPRPQGR